MTESVILEPFCLINGFRLTLLQNSYFQDHKHNFLVSYRNMILETLYKQFDTNAKTVKLNASMPRKPLL